MKFRLGLKDPNGVWHTTKELADKYGIEEEDADKIVSRWVHFGEYVYIDVDTELDTATIVTNRGPS